MVLSPMIDEDVLDVGEGDLYTGNAYEIPYFFETVQHKMMRPPGGMDSLSFRSWKDNYYQFCIDTYHQRPALMITSTLKDCYFMPTGCLSLEKSYAKYQRASEKKTPIKGSFSGFYSYGKRCMSQHDTLLKHLKDDNMYFTDEVLEKIYQILKRRVNND